MYLRFSDLKFSDKLRFSAYFAKKNTFSVHKISTFSDNLYNIDTAIANLVCFITKISV